MNLQKRRSHSLHAAGARTRQGISKNSLGNMPPICFSCVVMTLFDKKEGIFIRQRQFFYVLHKRQHL